MDVCQAYTNYSAVVGRRLFPRVCAAFGVVVGCSTFASRLIPPEPERVSGVLGGAIGSSDFW